MSIQRLNAKNKGIDFEVEFVNIAKNEASVSEGMHSPKIRCDEARIMQVLLGLQSNALKFTREGRVKIYVKILERDLIN